VPQVTAQKPGGSLGHRASRSAAACVRGIQ